MTETDCTQSWSALSTPTVGVLSSRLGHRQLSMLQLLIHTELQVAQAPCRRPRFSPHSWPAAELSLSSRLRSFRRTHLTRCPSLRPCRHTICERCVALTSRHTTYIPYSCSHRLLSHKMLASQRRRSYGSCLRRDTQARLEQHAQVTRCTCNNIVFAHTTEPCECAQRGGRQARK